MEAVTMPTPGRPQWTVGPLYQLMLEQFPEHRTELQVLDIQRLKTELGCSHEAIYKWLRSSRLTPANAKKIVDLINSPDNRKALRKAKVEPKTLQDFMPFFFN